MNDDNEQDVLVTNSKEVDIEAFRDSYQSTVSDLSWYISGCRDGYNWRRNIWANKSKNLRKNGPDAFPFKGAADSEAYVISQRIDTYVSLFMSALSRANIRAYPIEASDMGQARVTSNFLKWMTSTYIPDFKRQMELAGNNMLEKGIAITYCGWEREDRTFKQRLSLEQLGQISQELVRLILDGNSDEQLIDLLKSQFKGMTDKKCKKALRDLRKNGVAEFTIIRTSIDRPSVEDLDSDSDFLFPSYTADPQESPYCFRRTKMTAQQLWNKVATDGWNREFVEDLIKKGSSSDNGAFLTLANSTSYTKRDDELFTIVYRYARMLDAEDNSQGIYCTIFSPDSIGNGDNNQYAKHELLNGYDDYPVVVTKLSEDNKQLYEVLTVPEKLRGCQWQIKVERDARIDRNSLATCPPIIHPIGMNPPDMGPFVKIPYRRQGEISFGPVPQFNPGSVEMEQSQILEADRIMGLDQENPLSQIRQGYMVDKFLTHVANVIKMAFKAYQRFGKDEIFFRVSGSPDPQRFQKGDPSQEFDIKIMFDVQMNDPENVEADGNFFLSLAQMDKNGRINMDELIAFMANSRNPILADAILLPAKQAQQQITTQVMDDLSKIYAGMEMPARANGAQVALQVIQQYAQQPDVMQRMLSDESFKGRMEKYIKQYSFQMQQAQNAQIGRIGTTPSSVGQVDTQTLPQ
jgi:hypothetical protein